VPDEQATGIQSVEVFILAAPPPVWSATGSGGSVFYSAGQPSAGILTTNITVNSGDYVCILGACGTTTMRNSYGASPFPTSIGGMPVTISRFLTQNNIYTAPAPNYSQEAGGSVGRVEMYYQIGPGCVINSPAMGATVSTTVDIDHDLSHPTSLPVDVTYEWSTDSGTTYALCTAAATSLIPNPALGISTPATGLIFQWDSAADLVGAIMIQPTTIRITGDDGAAQGFCTVDVDVDNVAPLPTCTVGVISPIPGRNDIDVEVTPDSVSAGVVDVAFDYSLDGGATWLPATPGGTSVNPTLGLPVMTPATFTWDSRADGVALLALAPAVLVRALVNDGVSLVPGECQTAPFDVDNTSVCFTICGDCNSDAAGPSIIDSLVAAQFSAGIGTPTMLQTGCCDVNSSMSIDIIDALQMAQVSAGLPLTLICP